MKKPMLYADLVPDVVIGKHTDLFSKEMSDQWNFIFKTSPGDASGHASEGASMAVVLAMRALLTVVSPRPPGNIHARQKFKHHALPRLNETIHSEVKCTRKEIKRERRYVDFQVIGTGEDGHLIYEAQMSLIWAA